MALVAEHHLSLAGARPGWCGLAHRGGGVYRAGAGKGARKRIGPRWCLYCASFWQARPGSPGGEGAHVCCAAREAAAELCRVGCDIVMRRCRALGKAVVWCSCSCRSTREMHVTAEWPRGTGVQEVLVGSRGQLFVPVTLDAEVGQ